MFKSFLVLSNLIFSLMVNVIFGDGVKVAQNVPNNVQPGTSFDVELVVTKTDVSGFAKIQQELPEGFVAEVIESQGASFTFNDNKVKFIWMALPETDEFTIKYKVNVAPNATGKKILTGKFSYLYNNERMVVDLPENEIAIGGEEPKEEEVAEEVIEEQQHQEHHLLKEEGKGAKEHVVQASRTIEELANGNHKVHVTIHHDGVTGFAKVQEKLPMNASMAKASETKHGVFSFVDNQAKIVWMSLPEQKQIDISYVVEGATTEELDVMEGDFAFLYNEETRKAKIFTAHPEEAEEEEPVAEEVEEEKEEEIVEEVAPEPTPESVEEVVAEEVKKEVVPEPVEEEVVSIPSPENGVIYKVQICAGHKPVDVVPYFKSAFKFSEGPILVENHEGWIKYTIDKYNGYKDARDRRNVVTAGYDLPGPFVTAYNSGQRITVQEALMISNQKWIQ